MKKFLSFFLAICVLVPCAVLFSACGKGKGFETNVEYKVTDIEIVWASDEEKTEILDGKTEEEFMQRFSDVNGSLNFKDNGTVISKNDDSEEITCYYTKDGDTIKVYQDEAKEGTATELFVEGEKIVQKTKAGSSYETYMRVIYEKV